MRNSAINTLAVRALVRRPLRTSLMMLGIIVGICALSVLNSFGEGTRQDALQKFKNMLGTFDTVMIRPGAGRTRGMVSLTNVPPTLKFQDAEALIMQARLAAGWITEADLAKPEAPADAEAPEATA